MEEEYYYHYEGEDEGELQGVGGNGMWDLGSPLYDSLEIVSVFYLIDRKLGSFTTSAAAPATPAPPASASSERESAKGGERKVKVVEGEMRRKKKGLKKKLKASFRALRRNLPAACRWIVPVAVE